MNRSRFSGNGICKEHSSFVMKDRPIRDHIIYNMHSRTMYGLDERFDVSALFRVIQYGLVRLGLYPSPDRISEQIN